MEDKSKNTNINFHMTTLPVTELHDFLRLMISISLFVMGKETSDQGVSCFVVLTKFSIISFGFPGNNCFPRLLLTRTKYMPS